MTDLTTIATKLGREATTRVREFAAANPVASKAKDGVFTAVGLGVMGVQRATTALKSVPGVDATNVTSTVKKNAEEAVAAAKRQAAWIDERVTQTVKAVDEAVAPLEQRLPVAVRDARAKAREAAQKAHDVWTARFLDTPVAQVAPEAKTTATKPTATKATAAKKTTKK